MKAITRGTFGVGLMALVAAAGAQPAVTSLGGGVPLSVTNNLGGSIYVGGTLSSSATRWTLTNSGLSITEAGGTGSSGYLSSNGQVQVGAAG